MVYLPLLNRYFSQITLTNRICPNNLFFVLWNLMISWIVFILDRKIFPIHHTYIYSLVSYLFIKQDQMILTCNSAVASLMLSRFFLKKLEKNLLWYAVNKVIISIIHCRCRCEQGRHIPVLYIYYTPSQSLKWKWKFTGLNQILEFIFIYHSSK